MILARRYMYRCVGLKAVKQGFQACQDLWAGSDGGKFPWSGSSDVLSDDVVSSDSCSGDVRRIFEGTGSWVGSSSGFDAESWEGNDGHDGDLIDVSEWTHAQVIASALVWMQHTPLALRYRLLESGNPKCVA